MAGKKQKNTNRVSLTEKVGRILEAAESAGLEQNVMFVTTLKRYQDLMKILEKLSADIERRGAVVERRFASGQIGVDNNPSVDKYNQTANIANMTASTLMEILVKLDGRGFEKLRFEDDL
jgi:Tfp pilus assembly PilM family ATPase